MEPNPQVEPDLQKTPNYRGTPDFPAAPNLQGASELFFDAADAAGISYDPLAELAIDDDDIDESDGQQGPHTEFQAKQLYIQKPENRTASERIVDLFTSLAPRRRVLLSILEFLGTPKRSDALDAKVNKLQEYNVSVYSGYNYSLLLEEAGALAKVNEDGTEYDAEAEQLPDLIEVEGVRFYKPTNGKQVFWVSTEAGRAYLAADDPFGRLSKLLQEEPEYLRVYQALLEYCRDGVGRSGIELSAYLDNDPLLQEPRRYFSFFAKKLEDCGALEWASKWHTTPLGKRGINELFSASEGRGL